MAEKDAKPKKQSTIKQIIQIYKYTAKEDKALPWLEAGAFLLPVVVMIIIGLIAKWTWLTWIFTMITAIMLRNRCGSTRRPRMPSGAALR